MSRLSVVLCACWFLLFPYVAAAQERPNDPIVPGGSLPTVFLLDARGAEYRGKLLRVNGREVAMLVNDRERVFGRAEIVRIEKRGDSLKNGAIIGAVVGAALGLLAAGISDCPAAFDESCTGTRLGLFVTSVGIYTAVGTGIDAAIKGRTVIYQAPSATRQSRSGGAALRYSVRW